MMLELMDDISESIVIYVLLDLICGMCYGVVWHLALDEVLSEGSEGECYVLRVTL